MGDMADMALEIAEMEVEHYETHKYASHSVAYEEGLVDELGTSIGRSPSYNPSFSPSNAPKGAGACPTCGGGTTMKRGKYGGFYGCNGFPACKGSRGVY